MTRRQTMIACAVAAALAAPLTAGALQKEETLRQYPQASGNTSQIAPPDASMPATTRDPSQSPDPQQESSSAASGGTRAPAASEPSGRLPSRSIEERSRFSLPSESQGKPSR